MEQPVQPQEQHSEYITSGLEFPLWFYPVKQGKVHPPIFSKLTDNIKTEVAVIGAGIAGLTTAYLCAKEGKKVVVIEDGEICSGETGRSTAHISNAFDDHYVEIVKTLGDEAANILAESHSAAIDLIEEIVTTEKIQCDFERLDGYLFPGTNSSQDQKLINQEFFAARNAGLIEVELLDSLPLTTINRSPVLKFPKQGQFNPLMYCYGLSEVLRKMGVQIFTQTHASSFETGNIHLVTTSDKCTVECDYLVVTTNVPVNDRVEMYTKMQPSRTIVVVAKVLHGSVPKALYWDTLEDYHYIRIAPCDSQFDYLIVGGEDYRTGDNTSALEKIENLKSWTKAFFPVKEIVGYYTGQIIEPVDAVAFIGQNPNDYDNVFIATGDSGNGITHGSIAGILIRDLIIGRKNRWASLYDPSRKPIHTVSSFISDNLKTSLYYKDWVTPGDMDIEDIIPGTGAVVRCGLSKVAVYRDEKGDLHQCSAVCPHLGGIVTWNNLEKSWDCPVHGSRFDKLGNVINGPANKGLTPVAHKAEK